MSKKGSALMQVMVIGLIIAAFSVMILRYAITRSANLTRTTRVLSSQISAESCLDQYMAFIATSELSGEPPCSLDTECILINGSSASPNTTTSPMTARLATDVDQSLMVVTTFTVIAR
jgi:hypothetical protein